ncbi:hypothetical protein K7X08_023657 [Anisodus acutangulus]|uniref:Uncharacterized protein n=1 Tax=Anisodus acutangulus TaxID=402998 RepID=A0A9Q1L8J4_9SOLA|nr:hypothetical protein K7X08_023657 [Anisodus acutangulus]
MCPFLRVIRRSILCIEPRAVSSSSRRKVFIAPSSFSYRRLLPYLTDAAKEYSDVSEIEKSDTTSKSNDLISSLLKPEMQSTASNGSDSDVSKTLRSVEGDNIERNVSWGPQDLDDVLSKTQVGSRVFTNGRGLDTEALEECVQTTPPDADIFCKANMSDLGTSIENTAEQTEKKYAGVKAVSSISYRRLLPFLMDVAKNDPGGALSDPKFQKDLDCNRRLMSMSKEIPTNKEYSPKKDEIKEQETKLLEPNTCLSTEVSSSAAESFSKTPSSVFPDDVPNSQTLLNVEIKRKSETENTDISNTEKSEPECLNNVSPETSAGEYDVAIPNLLPISLEDFLSEYGVEDPKVEPVSPEADHMNLEVDCNEENRNAGDPTGTVEIHADAKLLMRF